MTHAAGSELTMYETAPGVGIALYRDVAISLSNRPLARGELEALERAAATAARSFGSAAILYVMDPSAGLVVPDEDARNAVIEVFRRSGKLVGTLAVVILADGFASAVLRGAVTSVSLVARPTSATKVFTELDQGVRWLAARTSRATATELQTAYEGLRARTKRSVDS